MINFLKGFIFEEDGMGTVEIVIIIAVLVGLALIFRDAIIAFATKVMSGLFANDQIDSDINPGNIRIQNGVQSGSESGGAGTTP